MPARADTILALLFAACSATAPDPTPSPTPAPPPAPAGETAPSPWAITMRQVGQHYRTIEATLAAGPTGDLRPVADAATAAADLMRLGYGRLENEQLPGFARHARDAESWFLQLALEARQAHGGLVRELFRSGSDTQCTSCHDGCKRARG